MNYKILIIEDDQIICEELMFILENSGFQPICLNSFEYVVKQISNINPHLILLDINLPSIEGFEICKQIRYFSKVPIIFVTSRKTDIDELKSITIGGDDFITKPYNISILIARINSLLKRTYNNGENEVLSYNGVVLNLENSKVYYNNLNIELTKNEVKIFSYLLKNQGRISSRMDIIETLWDNQMFIDDNTLSVKITRSR